MSTTHLSDEAQEPRGKVQALHRRQRQPALTPSAKTSTRRLGILQLGWFAHEKHAPTKIQQLIVTDNGIRVPGIISLIAQASQADPTIKSTYLCHPCVEWITKQRGEGSFCGYRNIQMLISWVLSNGVKAVHGDAFGNDGIPSILRIQELIEDAWDRGINNEGRVETGGIRGSRKHIGTPEVQALFRGVGVPCRVGRHVTTSSGSDHGKVHPGNRKGVDALESLLDYVAEYFGARATADSTGKVQVTTAPPIYLQRPHHSVTVVGIEIRKDGRRNLLVLDPKVRPSEKVRHAAQMNRKESGDNKVISLTPFRRGKWELGLYRVFETFSLNSGL